MNEVMVELESVEVTFIKFGRDLFHAIEFREPLIPILMYPAAQNNIPGAIIVSLLFSAVTIATMMSIVLAFKMGLSKINLKPVEKYSHLIAGAMIFFSGIAIQFLGL